MDDQERIRQERAELKAHIDQHFGGSYHAFAKKAGMPPNTVGGYINPRKKDGAEIFVDLRNVPHHIKSRLYAATKLEFLNPEQDIPTNLNDWQKELYRYMSRTNSSGAAVAVKLGIKESSFRNYLEGPVELERIKDSRVRESIRRLITPDATPESPVTAPMQYAAPAHTAITPSQPKHDDDKLESAVEKLAARLDDLSDVVLGIVPNAKPADVVSGTQQLVTLLNANLEQYGDNNAAQDALRSNAHVLELFGRCHELLSAIYQNNPFTAHRLKTSYRGKP